MKFLVLSDLHLEYADCAIPPPAADAVILAGDIAEGDAGIRWARETFADLPVFYVPGNHEYYHGEVAAGRAAMRAAAAECDVVLLDDGIAELPGLRLLGCTLWTGFDLFAGDDAMELAWAKADARRLVPDFDGRIQCVADGRLQALTPDMTQAWHRRSRAWLAAELARPFAGKTVVVTHHAPAAASVPAEYAQHPGTPAWASPLEALVGQADFWVHGHVHQAVDYRLGRCRVFANPRGYGSEAVDFSPTRLLAV